MPRFVRLSTFFAWLAAASICAAAILISAFYLYLAPQLPDAEQLKTTQLQTPMRIFTSDNKKIAEFGEKRRRLRFFLARLASPAPVARTPAAIAQERRASEGEGCDGRLAQTAAARRCRRRTL